MFSGKTEELIRRLKRAKFARQRVEIFKPALIPDTLKRKLYHMTATPSPPPLLILPPVSYYSLQIKM